MEWGRGETRWEGSTIKKVTLPQATGFNMPASDSPTSGVRELSNYLLTLVVSGWEPGLLAGYRQAPWQRSPELTVTHRKWECQRHLGRATPALVVGSLPSELSHAQPSLLALYAHVIS